MDSIYIYLIIFISLIAIIITFNLLFNHIKKKSNNEKNIDETKLKGLFQKKDESRIKKIVCSSCGSEFEVYDGDGRCPYCGAKFIKK